MKRVTREEVLQLAARAGLNGQHELCRRLTRIAGGMSEDGVVCYALDQEAGEKLLKSTLIETGVGR